MNADHVIYAVNRYARNVKCITLIVPVLVRTVSLNDGWLTSPDWSLRRCQETGGPSKGPVGGD